MKARQQAEKSKAAKPTFTNEATKAMEHIDTVLTLLEPLQATFSRLRDEENDAAKPSDLTYEQRKQHEQALTHCMNKLLYDKFIVVLTQLKVDPERIARTVKLRVADNDYEGYRSFGIEVLDPEIVDLLVAHAFSPDRRRTTTHVDVANGWLFVSACTVTDIPMNHITTKGWHGAFSEACGQEVKLRVYGDRESGATEAEAAKLLASVLKAREQIDAASSDEPRAEGEERSTIVLTPPDRAHEASLLEWIEGIDAALGEQAPLLKTLKSGSGRHAVAESCVTWLLEQKLMSLLEVMGVPEEQIKRYNEHSGLFEGDHHLIGLTVTNKELALLMHEWFGTDYFRSDYTFCVC